MASFAAQSALRAKWSSLVEEHNIEVTNKVTSVVGWLKQASLEMRAAGRRAVHTISGANVGTTDTMLPTNNQLCIIHFNDVYNVESRQSPEPVGGAARFLTAVKSLEHLNPLVLFSGDAFSPSMLSTYTKGEQMIPVLNEIGTHCAVFGNHDFDHGLDVLKQWIEKTTFPWLMSNVMDNETGRPLADGRITHVVHWSNQQIGLIGLVEKEWLDTLATINTDGVTFLDFVDVGQKLAKQLKDEGCNYVIALTHMRTPNDEKLGENCDDIDLILGGHDHIYEIIHINNMKKIIKSGTDFREFSKIMIDFNQSQQPQQIGIEKIQITSNIMENTNLNKILKKYDNLIDQKMDEILGCFAVPLDGRFKAIRSAESNLGNWVCDVVLAATDADLVVINSGTFRSDQVHPAGDFTVRDLTTIIPMRDPLIILRINGHQIWEMLENGVSMYPKLEGRFPQISGIKFAFEPSKPAGQRVNPEFIKIGDDYLKINYYYKLTTKSYMHSGCDGYSILKNLPIIVDESECPELGLIIQNHFQSINMRLGKTKKNSIHRQSLVTLSRRHSLIKMFDYGGGGGGDADLSSTTQSPPLRRASTVESPSLNTRLTRRASIDDLEEESCQLTPKIDHRIIIINNDDKKLELQLQRQRYEENTAVIVEVDECSPQN